MKNLRVLIITILALPAAVLVGECKKAGQALPINFGGGTLEYHNTWTITVLP